MFEKYNDSSIANNSANFFNNTELARAAKAFATLATAKERLDVDKLLNGLARERVLDQNSNPSYSL